MLQRTASFCSLLLAVFATAPGAQEQAPARSRAVDLALRVEIVDGVATTHLDQVLRNDSPLPAEVTWILPLPEGAVADGFTMTMNGVPTAGDVLGADQARGIYEGIVRTRRDPGLLEYLGNGLLRARVFPVPAHGEVEVVVGFRQVLPTSEEITSWSFALDAVGIAGLPPASVSLDLTLRSTTPLKNAFSPVRSMRIVQRSEHEVHASFEGERKALTEGALTLFYGLSARDVGLNLFTHQAAGSDEGTFLLLISPKQDWPRENPTPKSITFVLDVSGSMQGRKLEQAQGALQFFLRSLGPTDLFNVIPFSSEAEPLFTGPVPATPTHVERALSRSTQLRAAGGTNIASALEAALRSSTDEEGRVPLVVFLTDGRPTVGLMADEPILAAARAANTKDARLFVLGVGNDVQTHLLDLLAAEAGGGRGARDYVREDEDLEVKTSALFAKLSQPLMTDLELAIDGLELHAVAPAHLPDLFRGERLEIAGRYRGSGSHAIRLKGRLLGEICELVDEGTFAAAGDTRHDFVPILWAERRVGMLLDAIRLAGFDEELVSEVTRLGREYRIVTPYTSHLILEEGLRLGGGAGSPGGPGSPGQSTSGSDGWYLGRGARRGPGTTAPPTPAGPSAPRTGGGGTGPAEPREPSAEEIALALRDAGVLPEDAPVAELMRLAGEVRRELQDSFDDASRLGSETHGTSAVDESTYLARLVAGGATASDERLLATFTRRIQDKVFLLRRGVWTDRAFAPAQMLVRRKVEAFSDEYFALLRERPALRPFLALSSRLIVVLGAEVFEVVEAADER